MNDRRARRVTTLPDGSLWDEDAFRAYLANLDRRTDRATVRRLSASDPEIAAFEATARGSRAA
jgi:hypothetical protein